METKIMAEIYQKIAEQLMKMIPEEWDKVYVFSKVIKGLKEMFFYYYPVASDIPVHSLQITDKFEIAEDQFTEQETKLYGLFDQLHSEFVSNKMEPWTNLTYILNSNGKLSIDYDYTDFTKNDGYLYTVVWKYKYLDIMPPFERKRERKAVDDYIASLNKDV